MPVVPAKSPASAADRFRTVTLRVNPTLRTAQIDGLQSIYYGDTINVVIDNISGIDPTALQLWIWEKEVPANENDRLAYATGFAAPTGSASRATKSITLDSTNLRDALAATPVGTPLVVRLIIRETNMPIIDQDIEVYPNPYINADPQPDPDDVAANPYVRRDDLRAWALNELATTPLTNMDEIAAAITNILTKLSDVTAT